MYAGTKEPSHIRIYEAALKWIRMRKIDSMYVYDSSVSPSQTLVKFKDIDKLTTEQNGEVHR